MEKGEEIQNIKDADSYPLHTAARDGDLVRVIRLLDGRIDVNQRNRSNLFTPLHVAVQEGQFEVAQCLLDRSADIGAKAQYGEEPLRWQSLPDGVPKLS